jgi:hypothetical protein
MKECAAHAWRVDAVGTIGPDGRYTVYELCARCPAQRSTVRYDSQVDPNTHLSPKQERRIREIIREEMMRIGSSRTFGSPPFRPAEDVRDMTPTSRSEVRP